MASFSTTKQSVLDRINTLASNAATTAEESIYLSKALREAAFDQRFVWRGAWTQGLVYVAGDVAQYDGNAFVCTVVHTASSVFASDSAKWDTMVVGGAQWTTGSSVPANSVGEDGDWFYNTADETIHNKQGGSWTSIADLGGSRWTSSATVPANSAGEIGDFHMDTATQKIHEKTGATAWTELADLTPNADWNATSGNNGFISNKPSFKTVGGSSIIGSGDITVADTQDLSISGQTLSLTNSPSVTLPDADTQDLSISGQTLSLTNSPSVTLPGGKVLQVVTGSWNPGGSINTTSTSYVNTGIPTEHIQTIKANSKIVLQYSGWHLHANLYNNNISCIITFYRSHDNASWTKCAESETGGYMFYEYQAGGFWIDLPGHLNMSYPGGAAGTHHYFQVRYKQGSPGANGHFHHSGGLDAQEDTAFTANLWEVEI